jgi:hypothetical protein
MPRNPYHVPLITPTPLPKVSWIPKTPFEKLKEQDQKTARDTEEFFKRVGELRKKQGLD